MYIYITPYTCMMYMYDVHVHHTLYMYITCTCSIIEEFLKRKFWRQDPSNSKKAFGSKKSF